MHTIPFEIPPPKNEADFERMCAQIYGVVFDDRMPKMNGRRGQAQGGVDVFVKEPGVGRVGIQCKKYTLKPVTWTDVVDEVEKADKHKTPIKKLILATTAVNDAVLLKLVQQLSDERESSGLFSVEIEFWEDICLHIDNFPVLQNNYAPHTPGAAFHRQEALLSGMSALLVEQRDAVLGMSALPGARADSADRLITDQLDRTNELLKVGRYRDALEHLAVVGKDQGPFDAHQKARWNLQKGLSLWFIGDDDHEAAALFIKAFNLYPDDERMAAAHVRGLLLLEQFDEAEKAGESSLERFPESQQVWFALANVRLVRGATIQMKDVPGHMKAEPDTFHFVSQAELKAGNLEEAIKLSQAATEHPAVGFFSRANALRIATECGARFPVGAMAGALPELETKALEFAVGLFQPWHERLWDVQSKSLDEAVGNLGYAFLMLHRFSDALALCRDSEVHACKSADILRIQVTALLELNRESELLSLAETRLEEMNSPSLAIVGQVAARDGNFALLQRAVDVASSCSPPDEETLEILTALRWEALTRVEQGDVAAREILAAKVDEVGTFVTACVAARVLRKVGHQLEAQAIVERAKSLVGDADADGQKLMLAELLFHMSEYAEAARWYEQLAIPGRLSEIHNRLLACYVRTHNRRKAKEVIGKMPAHWIEDDDTLSLAIELGQQAADWEFLRPLVSAQMKKQPERAGSWLFKLSVSLHSSTPAEFQNDLRSVPEFLEGPIRATTQLASLELRYGEAERGMRRLYRMLRRNLDEPEALSAYFISVVSGPDTLPHMDAELQNVAAGCCVTLRDEFGHPTQLVIDPCNVGELPKREGYSTFDSAQAMALMGSVVGQQVGLPSLAFGETRQYTVMGIQSAYRYLLQVVQERAKALGGLPHMKLVPLGDTGDVDRDFAYMKAEVMRSSTFTRELFGFYGKGHMTLSGFAARQGRSPVEAILGWPHDETPLYTCSGTAPEREAALGLLNRADATYVIDALTIAELVHLGIPEVLGHLSKVLVSPVSKAALEELLRAAQVDRSVATSGEVDGKLAVFEHGASYHQRRIDFFSDVLAALDRYCEVRPAYGELGSEGELPRLVEVLEPEEVEILLLAKSTGATVITLDGRLRFLMEAVAQVPGVWPQALVMHCASKQLVESGKLVSATVRQFLTNRSYVSLGSSDLTWMVLQGGVYLQRGIQRFKTYLSSETYEFASTVNVAFGFLRQIGALRIQLGAFGELFEHLLEAALRHKHCPSGFLQTVIEFVDELTDSFNQTDHVYGPVNVLTEHRLKMQRFHLAGRITRARERAGSPAVDRPVAVRVLFCSSIPFLVNDKSDGNIEPVAEA